ncbi:MAG: hypothetical protein ACRDT6_16780 [Micromonosporaceae bacterium]
MRTLLRWVTTRYGIAGILVLGVLAVVVVSRLAGGELQLSGGADPGPDPYPSISYGPDDGVIEPDGPAPTVAPTLPAGVPDPLPVAQRFATAWADHEGVTGEQWRQRLAGDATGELMAKLDGADPTGDPSVTLTGKPVLDSVIGGSRAEVSVAAETGVLLLGLAYSEKRWRVDTISWRSE